jgi:hypothetical protein
MLIGKFAMINNGVLLGVFKFDRSVLINTFQAGNNLDFDLVTCRSESLTDDIDYECWPGGLGHLFKVNVNRKLSKDKWLIPDYLTTYSCKSYGL